MDTNKDEVLSIVYEELGNMLREVQQEVQHRPGVTAEELVKRLLDALARRSRK